MHNTNSSQYQKLSVRALDRFVRAALVVLPAPSAWHSKPVWYIQRAFERMIDPQAVAFMTKRMKTTYISVQASHVATI